MTLLGDGALTHSGVMCAAEPRFMSSAAQVTSLTCGKMREGIISGRKGVVMSGDLQLTADDDDRERERKRGF